MSSVSTPWKPRHNVWAIALTVTMATFMEVLDTSIANVALPHIAGNLSAGQDESTWVLTSYLVSNAIVLPMSAWLATRMGRKRFYMMCVMLFGISSLLCGLAPTLGSLIFFRVLQGAGGGGLAPSEQAILADTFEPRKRGLAFAVYGLAVVLAPAIGPTLGGYITDNYSWRWIFFINVPVALVSLFFTSRLVEDPPYLAEERRKVLSVDWTGLGLIAVGLGSLQVILDKGERDDWFSSNFINVFAVLAVVGIVGAIVWEYYQDHPIVDVRLFGNRTFAVAFMMMFMVGFTLYGSTVLIPQLLQTLMGYTALSAGMTLSPGGFTIMLLMPLVGTLVAKTDARWLAAFGFVASSAALFYMTGLNLDMDFRTAALMRVYQSIGIAFLFVPINTLSYTGVPQSKNNSVSALTNLARNVGGSIGISTVTTLLARRSQFHQTVLASRTSSYDPAFRRAVEGLGHVFGPAGGVVGATAQAYGQVYAMMQRQAAVLSYIDTIYIFAIACAAMAPLAFIMKKPRAGPAASH